MAAKMDASNSSVKDKVYQALLKSYVTFNDMYLSKGFLKKCSDFSELLHSEQ